MTIVEYRGLSVAEMTELRKNLKAEDSELKVYKNSLVQRATVDTVYEGLNDQLTGPNALAFGNSDAVAPARVIVISRTRPLSAHVDSPAAGIHPIESPLLPLDSLPAAPWKPFSPRFEAT